MKKQHYHIGHDLLLHTNPEKTPKKTDQSRLRNLLLAKSATIGYYLITPLLLGVFFGVAVDNFFHTKPKATILLLMLGTVSTFYNLYKLTKE